jgi:heme/copper-type cytochrome/quinol oxidase subunit 4
MACNGAYNPEQLHTTKTLTLVRFYCGGLSLSLLSLSVISLTHVHRKIPNQRFRKCFRLVFRAFIAITILLLPFAHMNSLQLIATTTSLIICVLVVELIGLGCWGENMFWERSCGRDKTTYSARCGLKREELEKSFKEGTVIDVEEIAKREGGEKGSVAAV